MGTMGMYYFQRIIISDGDSTSQAPAPTYSTAFKERPNHQYLGTKGSRHKPVGHVSDSHSDIVSFFCS